MIAVNPTTANMLRQPQYMISVATNGAPTAKPMRVPLSKRPEGKPRSREEKSMPTIFVPPGR